MRERHLAIDGSTVDVNAPDLDAESYPSSVGVYTVNGTWQEFTTSYRGFGQAVADDLGLKLSESYAYQDGTLRLGTTSVKFPAKAKDNPGQTDIMHLAVWEGKNFSVHTHLYNGAAHDLLPVFDAFEITEYAQGIHLRPRRLDRTHLVKEPSLLRESPSVGLLEVRPLTRNLARSLPKRRGTPSAGGEVFSGRRPGSLHFIIVGSRSYTTIMPEGEDCDKDGVSRVLSVQTDWQAAA